METYLLIRNNLFLVSFWKRAPFHFACRPSRPGKTKFRQRFAVGFSFYWVQLETYLCLEIPNWKPFALLGDFYVEGGAFVQFGVGNVDFSFVVLGYYALGQ